MAEMHDDQGPGNEPRAGRGGFLTRKVGPLPLWVWMLLALAALYAVVAWRAAHATNTSSAADTSSSQPADTTPAPITQIYATITPTETPPAGGRTDTPGAPPSNPAGGSSGSPTTGSSNPPPASGGSSGSPTPTPKPAGTTVTVAKFTSTNPPWNSTLSGIAKHEGYGTNWQAIWNAPANAALKKRRKEPNMIQPGDKVVVPAK